ncbi:hypothetical protein MNEG_8276 [Monoraphidium neglectum]|uniref:Uncharacterized protein n=1 Tax=Monoraphidium neglectum TaxID=145388 RepID=A0A0D2JKB9_9CHLO|nr:hypothetical protein MNEG_8276 [Monoraphidium neglectum]KIY99682.1 hypothetical protein MNEG_8276 [Monoraphidium neglectum]|eukprot:XP_013898702.1 hypothetical protein MNEG_8276 [Monoraphidium neglectum]
MDGFEAQWDELMSIAGRVLASGRRSVAVAAAQLLTSVLQSYKHPHPGSYPWKRAFAAVDAGVAAMAVPNSRAPLQARSELLSGLVAVYQAQKDAFDLEDLQALLRWLDAFIRYPLGGDDVTPVPGVLPAVQKAALAALSQVASGPVAPAAAWPDVLRALAGLLCPFRAAQQRKADAEAAAAAAAAAGEGGGGSIGGVSMGRHGAAAAAAAAPPLPPHRSTPGVSPSSSPPPLGAGRAAGLASFGPGRAALLSPRALGRVGSRSAAAREAAAQSDARMLTPLLMARVVQLLVPLYADKAPWKVRAALFGPVAGALGECMAMAHTTVCAAAVAAAAREAAAAGSGSGGGDSAPLAAATAAATAAAGDETQWPGCDEVGVSGCVELWRQSAAGFSSVVKAGLPAVNIVFVNQHQAPAEDTWQLLAAAFEMFLLGVGLPPHLELPPQAPRPRRRRRVGARASEGGAAEQEQERQAAGEEAASGDEGASEAGGWTAICAADDQQHPGDGEARRRQLRGSSSNSGSKPPASQGSAAGQRRRGGGGGSSLSDPGDGGGVQQQLAPQGADLRCVVLDTLTDNVLSACGSAPHETRQRLVGVVAAGASDADAAAGPAPFGHLCLRRLGELCARGSGARGADACLLEVARLALPPLLDRCEAVLNAACSSCSTGGGGSSSGCGVHVSAGGAAPTAEAAPRGAPSEDDLEDAICALDVLLGTWLEAAVLEAAGESRPQLAAWLMWQEWQQQLGPLVPHHHALHGGGDRGGGGGGGTPGAGATSSSFLPGGSGSFLSSGSGGAGAGGAFLGAPGPGGAGGAAHAAPRASSGGAHGAERTRGHLLALYGPLARCIGCGEARVRERVQAAMLAVGDELGLAPIHALAVTIPQGRLVG